MNNISSIQLDAWTASSLLQKSIRRGECEYATAAALCFYRMRGNAIWRRMTLIAFEDIGPADPALCIAVTECAASATTRSRAGSDSDIIIRLISRMCAAPKNREADYLICAAKQAPFADANRALVAGLNLAERVSVAGDPRTPLLDRAVAAWMASGINGGGPPVLSGGDIYGLMASFAALGIQEEFTRAALFAGEKTGEPIVVMTPLLTLAIAQSDQGQWLIEDTPPDAILCNGIPSWVFDKHTRLGKAAIRRLLVESREVRDCIAEFVPEYKAFDVAAMAAFYADAVPTVRRLAWAGSDELYKLGIRTDMMKVGTPDVGVSPIAAIVLEHLGHLNDIRKRLREPSGPRGDSARIRDGGMYP